MRKLILLAPVLGAALMLAGCATEVGHYTFLGKPYAAKPPNAQVEVYTNGVPARTFDRVAILDVRCEAQGFMTPNLQQDALPMLIRQARAAGCDAIIEIVERKPADNWTLETKVKNFSAVGIVYK
jgi:hypothetical protein